MPLSNEQQSVAIRLLADAIVDTVRDVEPMGAPEGVLYAAFNAAGGDLSLFGKLIDALVAAGRLRRVGSHLLRLGDSA